MGKILNKTTNKTILEITKYPNKNIGNETMNIHFTDGTRLIIRSRMATRKIALLLFELMENEKD